MVEGGMRGVCSPLLCCCWDVTGLRRVVRQQFSWVLFTDKVKLWLLGGIRFEMDKPVQTLCLWCSAKVSLMKFNSVVVFKLYVENKSSQTCPTSALIFKVRSIFSVEGAAGLVPRRSFSSDTPWGEALRKEHICPSSLSCMHASAGRAVAVISSLKPEITALWNWWAVVCGPLALS